MESFLRISKKYMSQLDEFKIVKVVSGNEACDLDSAVSALVYGLLLNSETKRTSTESIAVLPILNIPYSELPLKTEVTYWLKENNIPLDQLIFRDQIDIESLHASQKLQLVLVDHHTLSPQDEKLRSAVTEIIDHRPQEQGWEWPGQKVNLVKVGSCCTLVAKEVISRYGELLTQQVGLLLYGPIMLDTACLNVAAGRTEPMDYEIVSVLEKRFEDVIKREKIFQCLLDARTDVSGLSSSQLLIRDLKVVDGIPICGLPILVKDFIKHPDIENALHTFCSTRKPPVAVILGLLVSGSTVTRDIAVFSALQPTIGKQLEDCLNKSTTPSLLLEPVVEKTKGIPGLVVFQQGNIQASRKQILPIIKAAVCSIQQLKNSNP